MDDTVTTPIDIPYPEAGDHHLKITVGACRLTVAPGSGPKWVSGTYEDVANRMPLKIDSDGGTVKITQDYRGGEWWGLVSGSPPRLDMTLGTDKPYLLTLEVGASESQFDLGGLPVTRLLIKQGAGRASFDFSAPNPQPMSLLDLDAGAVGLDMKNLANANFAEMSVDGGAASYKFDFGGALRRDAHVKITTGMASVEIQVPAATAAKVTAEAVLGGLNIGDGFTKTEGAFWTQAALAGQSPVLTIHTNVTMGALHLRAT